MGPETGLLIMRPFNAVFFLTFAAFILLLVVGSLLVRGKSLRTKKTVIVTACVLTLIGFFVYKYFLSIDTDYDKITAAMGGFNWWGELPLHLCNINMILIPIAVLTGKRPLLSFCFFVGPLGAMMALMMPGNGFSGYSLLLPRMIGFFGTHFMVVILALSLVTFGLYRPRFRDILPTVVTLAAVALVAFGISMLFRATGLHPKANYFFSVETEGNPVLDLFHSWIPIPFLYLLPGIVVFAAYASAVTLGFYLTDRIRGASGKKAPKA
ncbi:MAG: YwaF family protein [Clostridia bacterium]|nr:YwaF family protein [Clostridia bacterium]